MSELSIKVIIGGRTYPLTIKREEEEKIRKAVSEIENNIKNLKDNYAVVDMQDLLAMTSLEYATESIRKNSSVEFDHLSEEIMKLKEELERNFIIEDVTGTFIQLPNLKKAMKEQIEPSVDGLPTHTNIKKYPRAWNQEQLDMLETRYGRQFLRVAAAAPFPEFSNNCAWVLRKK